VFLTAEGEPFYFGYVLLARTERREEVAEVASRTVGEVAGCSLAHGVDGRPGEAEFARTLPELGWEYDAIGTGSAVRRSSLAEVVGFLLLHHAGTTSEGRHQDGGQHL
jgi:uncharacterized protein